MERHFTQAEVAKIVGRTHQAINYAIARGWIRVSSRTGRGSPLFTEEAVREFAALRKLEVRLELLAA